MKCYDTWRVVQDMAGTREAKKARAAAVAISAPFGGFPLIGQQAPYTIVKDTSNTDEALAAATAAGDTDAFGTLVERYEGKLLRYGRKFLARQEEIEDIVQDAFENAFRNIKSFDPNRPFSPWIFRIAHNAFVNALRRNKLVQFVTFDFDTFLAHADMEAPKDLEREQLEMRKLIERGLEQLKPASREILILYYLENFSYQEIADILHVPMGTVGVRLSRARDQLRAVYKDLDIAYE